MLFCIVFGIVFVMFGLLLSLGKAMYLIPGWQQMSEKEKSALPIKRLLINIGSIICLAGVIMLGGAVFPAFRTLVMPKVLIGWLVLSGADLLFIRKSQKYAETGSARNRR